MKINRTQTFSIAIVLAIFSVTTSIYAEGTDGPFESSQQGFGNLGEMNVNDYDQFAEENNVASGTVPMDGVTLEAVAKTAESVVQQVAEDVAGNDDGTEAAIPQTEGPQVDEAGSDNHNTTDVNQGALWVEDDVTDPDPLVPSIGELAEVDPEIKKIREEANIFIEITLTTLDTVEGSRVEELIQLREKVKSRLADIEVAGFRSLEEDSYAHSEGVYAALVMLSTENRHVYLGDLYFNDKIEAVKHEKRELEALIPKLNEMIADFVKMKDRMLELQNRLSIAEMTNNVEDARLIFQEIAAVTNVFNQAVPKMPAQVDLRALDELADKNLAEAKKRVEAAEKNELRYLKDAFFGQQVGIGYSIGFIGASAEIVPVGPIIDASGAIQTKGLPTAVFNLRDVYLYRLNDPNANLQDPRTMTTFIRDFRLEVYVEDNVTRYVLIGAAEVERVNWEPENRRAMMDNNGNEYFEYGETLYITPCMFRTPLGSFTTFVGGPCGAGYSVPYGPEYGPDNVELFDDFSE